MSFTTAATPVVLCGRSGTRLWPLSRKSFSKQFVPLICLVACAAALGGGDKFGRSSVSKLKSNFISKDVSSCRVMMP